MPPSPPFYSLRARLFPLYRPVKVAPARPGRIRSTALAPTLTAAGAGRVRGAHSPTPKVDTY